MAKCRGCGAEIGPTESPDCPTHRRNRGQSLTNGDMAVFALEMSDRPISLYDIRRTFQREFGWTPSHLSLNATVAQDRRCCWAGRGIYSLWRHGLVPGPRRLRDVVRVVLYAHGSPLTQEELTFTLRHLGYRFQPASLHHVLAQEPEIVEPCWHYYEVNESEALGRELGLTPAVFDAVTQRAMHRTRVALKEREQRLAGDRGLASGDPIYTEGHIDTAGPYR